jgi:hypothetical protein
MKILTSIWLPDQETLSGERHIKQQCVIGLERDRLAPMGIKERLSVEAHELANQVAKRGVRVSLYQALDSTEEFWKLICRQRHLGNNAEAAATTALQRPEKIGISAGIRDKQLAVCGNDLGLQQARGG